MVLIRGPLGISEGISDCYLPVTITSGPPAVLNQTKYNASSIEVLTGLEPVRKRPGMYTQTERPNHLAHEVIDNAVDEALAGFADRIEVVVYKDGSLEVTDNGRGMPVDLHPEEKVAGVEVILTRLHAGGKFNHSNYRFAGGLHGVGVSVVNALSSQVEINIRRDKMITKRLKDALALVDIRVLDHLVIGADIVSFAERGLL